MLGYIVRRILYMIPTVFGVILVTFILFNVAAGDPAVMRLGKQAMPKTLEEYDVQRGYNKPLFCGYWGRTRAYVQSDFGNSPWPWGQVEGVRYANDLVGRILLPAGGEYGVPLAFSLSPDERYRWKIKYRLTAQGDRSPGRAAASLVVNDASEVTESTPLETARTWKDVAVAFRTGDDTSRLQCSFAVEDGALEISSIVLERRANHFFDSQLWFFLGHLARLDFGTSDETSQRVSQMIKDGILPSLALTVPMFIVGLIVSVSLSLVCAFFRNSLVDRLFVVVSVILMSVNYLVWIVFGQYFLAYVRRWFPIWGFEHWRYLILPCVIGVVSGLGASLRFYRTVMLDEMYKDYVRTAFAKGVSKRGVLFRHVLKNAMIPILTSVVMAIPFLYTGSLLLESFFGIPGLGRLSFNALLSADTDVIRAVVVMGAMLYVVVNLITDITYTMVDPRVRLR